MNKRYIIGTVKKTTVSQHLEDVKNVLIKSGIISIYTPDEMLSEALTQGLLNLNPKQLEMKVYGLDDDSISFSINGSTFFPIEFSGEYSIFHDGMFILRKNKDMYRIETDDNTNIIYGVEPEEKGDSLYVQSENKAMMAIWVSDVKPINKLDTPIIYIISEGQSEKSAILGEAILGYAILGNAEDVTNKLDTPVIRLEIVEEPLVKLATPNIYLYEEEVVTPYKQELEYLESSGTQWIDTGYAFKDDFSWEIDFNGITQNKTVFGGRTSIERTAILYQYNVTSTTTCPIGSSNGQATPFKLSDLSSGRHTVKMAVASNKGSVWVDGTQMYDNTAFAGSYISGTTQAIFADNFGNGDVQEYTSSKVYSLKMWQGTELVRDFIPVLDLNDVPCMYDRVTNELYYNNGTGEFSYGTKEDKPKLSTPIIRLEQEVLPQLETPTIELVEIITKLDAPVIDIVEV